MGGRLSIGATAGPRGWSRRYPVELECGIRISPSPTLWDDFGRAGGGGAAQSGGQFGSLPPERVVVNARYPADSWTLGMHCWQGCPDAFREIGCAISGLRRLVNQGTPPEFIKRQCRVNPARVVEVAVDQTIKEMADVKTAGSSGGIRVADDVDRATVGEQVIEFRPVGELVDPR